MRGGGVINNICDRLPPAPGHQHDQELTTMFVDANDFMVRGLGYNDTPVYLVYLKTDHGRYACKNVSDRMNTMKGIS